MSETPFQEKFSKLMEGLDDIARDVTDKQYKDLVETVADLNKMIQSSYLVIFKQLFKCKKINSLQNKLLYVYQNEQCYIDSDSD